MKRFFDELFTVLIVGAGIAIALGLLIEIFVR